MLQIKSALFSGAGAAIAIACLAFLDVLFSPWILLMAPFGASAVLVFGLPDSPLAQTRNVVGGHLLTATIGLCFVSMELVNPMTLALATGLGVSAMLLSKTTHPPAGANPILIMVTHQQWSFLFTPVLVGALIIVIVGRLAQYTRAKALP